MVAVLPSMPEVIPLSDYAGSSGPQDRRDEERTIGCCSGSFGSSRAAAFARSAAAAMKGRGSRLRAAAGFARSPPIGTRAAPPLGGVVVDLSRDTCTVTRKVSRKLISLDDF